MDYCGRTHADQGKAQGLIPPSWVAPDAARCLATEVTGPRAGQRCWRARAQVCVSSQVFFTCKGVIDRVAHRTLAGISTTHATKTMRFCTSHKCQLSYLCPSRLTKLIAHVYTISLFPLNTSVLLAGKGLVSARVQSTLIQMGLQWTTVRAIMPKPMHLALLPLPQLAQYLP